MTRQRISIAAHDGIALAAYRHAPKQAARANVVIAAAMAVPQTYYADLAAYLADQGFCVWTFDYRDMAESATGSMRNSTADISIWIARDYDAVIQHAGDADNKLPLLVIGHSLGGQVAPLLPSNGRISGLVNIAVGSGAVRHNQPKLQRSSRMLWYFLVPLLCPLFGYFPGRRIGVIGDLPAPAMYQWRRWCVTPDYILSGEPAAREAYARATFPILALTFLDDELLRASGSRMLHEAYVSAKVDYREVGPEDFGLRRIGHFGFFKPAIGRVMWPLVSNWLNQRVGEINDPT
ncbi:MAG TPA: alpha/beta fold hydrolase [Burkholderiaceae bacterium]|jgi:predicted alpha/beta hydrolase